MPAIWDKPFLTLIYDFVTSRRCIYLDRQAGELNGCKVLLLLITS